MSKPFVHLNLTRPLAVLDLETTGILPRLDRIVEIAVVKFAPSGERTRFLGRVNPGIPIPPAATVVHRIRDEDVADCPTFGAIAPSLNRFLKPCDLCGFNLKRFDLPCLLAEFARVEIHFPLNRRGVVDVLEIYRQREPRDLAAAARRYLGREHTGAHGALADVCATAAVLDAQLEHHADLPRTVAELHARFAEVDLTRRLHRDGDGQVVFTFGKYAGRPLDEVARTDPPYLHWLLGQDFLPDFLALVERALARA